MLSNVQVQLQLRKGFEHFNTSKHRAFKQWRCTLCFLAALWTTLDHTLFRRIIKPLRFYGLKGRLTLVLDINYVIWNVLPFTDAITFPNSQTDISIFESKLWKLLKCSILFIQRVFFDSSTILTAAVVPFTGCFVNAYPLSNESFNNLAEDSLQTEASLVSKKHLHAILHLQAFQKK